MVIDRLHSPYPVFDVVVMALRRSGNFAHRVLAGFGGRNSLAAFAGLAFILLLDVCSDFLVAALVVRTRPFWSPVVQTQVGGAP